MRRVARTVTRGRAFVASVLLLLCLTLVLAPAAFAEGFYGGSSWPADVRSLWEPKDVARALDGLVFTADSRAGRVVIYDSAGAYVGQFDGSDAPAGQELVTPTGVAIGPDANVYVADLDADRISVFSPAGEYVRSWGSRGVGNGQFYGPSDVRFDGSGLLYVADQFNDRIQVFTTAGVHVRTFGASGNANGQLSRPDGLSITGSEIYVADSLNKRVQVFSLTGAYVTQWGWTLGTSTNPTWSRYGAPSGVLSGTWGAYVADAGRPIPPAPDRASVIESCTSAGALVATYGSLGSADDQLDQPGGMLVDPAGVLVIADQGNDRLSRFNTLNATWLTPWFYNGSADSSGMKDPQGIAVDPDGSVWVADSLNGRIQHFSATGALLGTAVTGLSEPSGIDVSADGATVCVVEAGADRVSVFDRAGNLLVRFGATGAASGQFASPRGVALAPNGDILVADTGNSRIQRFSSAGVHLQTIGAIGALLGQFREPEGVSVADDGKICVADTDNHRVQVFDAAGAAIRAFGSIGSGAGLLREPTGITWDPSTGRIVVADTGNYRFQIFDAAGTVVTSVGERGASLGEFRRVRSVAVNSVGGIYTTDTGNDCVQRFLYDAVAPTTVASGVSPGWVNHPVTVTLTATDTASGVATTYYKLGAGDPVVYDGPFVVGAQGETSLRFWSVDVVGNVETETLATIQIDSEPPVGTMGLVGPSTVATTQVQIASNVTGANRMRVNGGAGWSGIMGYSALANVTVSGEGSRTITAQYLDSVDNTLTLSTQVLVDLTGPTTTLSGAPASGLATGTVTLTASATDALTAVAATYVSVDGAPEQLLVGSAVVVSGHGVHTVRARSVDSVGNAGPVVQKSFEIDTVFPSGTMTVLGGAEVVGASWVTITNSVTGATEARYDFGAGFGDWEPYTGFYEGEAPGEGAFAILGEFRDPAGNVLRLTHDLIVDFTPPDVVVLGMPTGVSQEFVTLSLEASDTLTSVKTIHYVIGSGPEMVYDGPVLFDAEGTYSFTYYAEDDVGNESDPATVHFTIDLPPPSGTMTLAGGASAVATTTVSLHSDVVGAAQMRIDVDGAVGTFVPFSADTTVTGLEQGMRNISVTYRSVVGEDFTLASDLVVDSQPPVANVIGIPSHAVATTVTVYLEASDGVTGVTGFFYTLDGGPEQVYTTPVEVGSDGFHTFAYRVVDLLGNTASGSKSFTIDLSRPAGTLTLAGGAQAVRTTVLPVLSDVTGATSMRFDVGAGFGPAVPFARDATVTVPGEGLRTVTGRYSDTLGNSRDITDTVLVDMSAPVVSILGAPEDPVTEPVTLLIGAVDTYTSVSEILVSVDGAPEEPLLDPSLVISGYGVHTVSARATDELGNTSEPVSVEFSIEAPAPVGSIELADGASSIASTTVPLRSEVTGATQMRVDVDGDIGAFVPYSADTTVTFAAQGLRTVSVTFRSSSGLDTVLSDSVLVDTAGPGITVSGVPDETVAETVTVTLEATDALSEVAALTYALDGGGEQSYTGPVSVAADGEHTLVYRAVDTLGNETTGQVAFTIFSATPAGSMTLAGGASVVGTAEVAVLSDVVDASSMRFDTGSGYGPWAPFSRDATVTLPGEGTRVVTAEYRSAGGRSTTASDSVAVDLTGPVSDRVVGRVTRLQRLDATHWMRDATVTWRSRDLGVVESAIEGYRYRLRSGVARNAATPAADLAGLRASTSVEVAGVDAVGNVGAWKPYALRFGTIGAPRAPRTVSANAAFTTKIAGIAVRPGETYTLCWYRRQADGAYRLERRFPMRQVRVGSDTGLAATSRLPRGAWIAAVERVTAEGSDHGVPSSTVMAR